MGKQLSITDSDKLNLDMLVLLFSTSAAAASKNMALASKVVKSNSKIIISLF